MENPCLIIIDMSQDFFRQGRLADLREEMCTSINGLVKHWRNQGFPIIWVWQEFKADLSDAFLLMKKTNTRITIEGTDGPQILPELDFRESDHRIIKKRYSSFFGTNLETLLLDLEPSHLVLCGTNTHACVRTTAIDAYQRDFEVIFADQGVNSYDLGFHEDSKRYLDGRVGDFLSNSQIMKKFSLER